MSRGLSGRCPERPNRRRHRDHRRRQNDQSLKVGLLQPLQQPLPLQQQSQPVWPHRKNRQRLQNRRPLRLRPRLPQRHPTT